MKWSDYVTRNAGRWLDRKLPPVEPVSPPLVQVFELDGDDPEHATLRPACTLMRGDAVLVASRWRTIDRVACQRAPLESPQTLLHLYDGAILGCQFDRGYWSRDAEEQELAAKDGAA